MCRIVKRMNIFQKHPIVDDVDTYHSGEIHHELSILFGNHVEVALGLWGRLLNKKRLAKVDLVELICRMYAESADDEGHPLKPSFGSGTLVQFGARTKKIPFGAFEVPQTAKRRLRAHGRVLSTRSSVLYRDLLGKRSTNSGSVLDTWLRKSRTLWICLYKNMDWLTPMNYSCIDTEPWSEYVSEYKSKAEEDDDDDDADYDQDDAEDDDEDGDEDEELLLQDVIHIDKDVLLQDVIHMVGWQDSEHCVVFFALSCLFGARVNDVLVLWSHLLGKPTVSEYDVVELICQMCGRISPPTRKRSAREVDLIFSSAQNGSLDDAQELVRIGIFEAIIPLERRGAKYREAIDSLCVLAHNGHLESETLLVREAEEFLLHKQPCVVRAVAALARVGKQNLFDTLLRLTHLIDDCDLYDAVWGLYALVKKYTSAFATALRMSAKQGHAGALVVLACLAHGNKAGGSDMLRSIVDDGSLQALDSKKNIGVFVALSSLTQTRNDAIYVVLKAWNSESIHDFVKICAVTLRQAQLFDPRRPFLHFSEATLSSIHQGVADALTDAVLRLQGKCVLDVVGSLTLSAELNSAHAWHELTTSAPITDDVIYTVLLLSALGCLVALDLLAAADYKVVPSTTEALREGVHST
eukprot:TRINITY_DN47669_c0_g1_i1.p1 TRINITY_DN47669_c0_g1~~TRINITY_DN47669_c0_g1_i1.p1  ORF type:complete len:659 (+),score=45.47 TRINITY_DN47669_c0_g1_i1:67-1977(+)